MNPNQKIITIGSVSLTIATVCFLMQIAILATTVTLHFKQNECSIPPNNQVVPCEPIIIEKNITEIVYLNNTTIEKKFVLKYQNTGIGRNRSVRLQGLLLSPRTTQFDFLLVGTFG